MKLQIWHFLILNVVSYVWQFWCMAVINTATCLSQTLYSDLIPNAKHLNLAYFENGYDIKMNFAIHTSASTVPFFVVMLIYAGILSQSDKCAHTHFSSAFHDTCADIMCILRVRWSLGMLWYGCELNFQIMSSLKMILVISK